MAENSFKKEIRLFDAIMLVAGTMIGSGIFIVSTDIAQKTGSAGYLLLVWVLTGIITVMGAVSYGELAGMFPKAGGQYVFLREAYGPLIAFLYGWTLFLVIQTGTIAAVAIAFAKFTGVFLPNILSEDSKLIEIGKFSVNSVQVLAILSIILLTYLNARGVKNGKLIQNIFGSTKILALVVLVLLAFLLKVDQVALEKNFAEAWALRPIDSEVIGKPILIIIALAMVGSLFSSDAWNNVTFAGDEIVNPKRTLPMSLALGTGLVTLLYLITNIAYLVVLPLEGNENGTDVYTRGIQFATNERTAVAVAEAIRGTGAVAVISLLIMVSTFGCNNGCILSGARVYYAIARDRLFFRPMAQLNRPGVPAYALWGQCLWACLLCLSGTYNNLLDYVMFAVMLFYMLTIGAIFVLRKKMPDAPRPYKAFGYPVLPAIYIITVLSISGTWLVYKPYTWGGFVIIALGLIAYFFIKKTNKVLPTSYDDASHVN